MATHLQQLLQSLCSNSEWNYAVFWKLKHRSRMVLTWEDAYYNNHIKHDPLESKSFSDAHDALGLAVAKMSYHVYSLGEGIVGQVAVTGKHQWIFAGDHLINSFPSPELCDGWQAQFSAGIKTIVVAAVVPHGVVQLGSLNKVNEDLKLLIHIRDLFSSLQDSSACHVQNPIQCSIQSSLQMSDISARTLCPDVLQECLVDLDKTTNKENICTMSPVTPSPPKSSNVWASWPGISFSDAVGLIMRSGLPGELDNGKQVQSVSGYQQSTHKTQNAAGFAPGANVSKLVPSDFQAKQQEENNQDPQFNCLEALDDLKSAFMCSAGSELHEALGPAFLKQCYPSPWESEKTEDRSTCNIPEIPESSMLTTDSGSDHLLEAVVANFCVKDSALKKTVSFSTSGSMLTTERIPEPSINTSHTIGSSCYSVGCSSLLEESSQNRMNSSDSCSIRSSTSACRDPLARPAEPGKPNKKRARPGENARPRPRDRQLIQDRIKELRELVPNGSKCSIDSLLERTIKHMVFMQSVTKHADKLSSCTKSRGSSNETGVPASGYEQGSSWAVEVGGHMKICPIVVENLNMNGQMLIEMLCEDCDHFLEIAEAIRSLGLTILKGATDDHGDKTWMRFVVEGQNNRNLHRMDVLWSLVQILQSKTTA